MTTFRLLTGDVRERLRELDAGSVQTCVTSPPYWGLRDYGTAIWEGGDQTCDHAVRTNPRIESSTLGGGKATTGHQREGFKGACPRCGAWRVDNQLGLEPTPEAYVSNLVEVFREVRRVLRDDGTVWLNLGDSYNSAFGTGQGPSRERSDTRKQTDGRLRGIIAGIKPKDLIGIPWRVAFALQQPYVHNVIRREADRAWLAALVDGEGTMTILQTTSPHGSGDSFPPVLQVRMCDVECIARAAEITGYGVASPRQDPPSQGGVRGSYQWRLSGGKAARVAADIFPHLCIKRKQAVIVWNHQRVRDSYETKRGVCIPREAVEKQQACRDLIKRLNAREPVDVPSWMDEPTVEITPGWYLRSDVIWSKPNPMPESVTDRPTKAHEYLFLLSKRASYYYDAAAIAEGFADERMGNPGAYKWTYGAVGIQGKGGLHTGDGVVSGWNQDGSKTGRNKRSVWHVATQPFSGAHFAVFPEALIEPCILAGSKPGALVLDTFTGSGTTGAVAIRHQRHFVGIELKPEYVELARKRIGSVAPLFAQEATA